MGPVNATWRPNFFFKKSPAVHKKFKSLPPFCFVQFNSLAVHRANAIKFKSNRQKMAKETTATHTRCHTAHQLIKFSIFIHWPPPPPTFISKKFPALRRCRFKIFKSFRNEWTSIDPIKVKHFLSSGCVIKGGRGCAVDGGQ